MLQKEARPNAISIPRRIAIPLLPKVKPKLQRLEKMGVVSRVQEPTDWCAGMVVVPKEGGRVRICVDLTRLNESVCRERHPLPAVEQTLAQLAEARRKFRILADTSQKRICIAFNRLPFGITSAPEHFQRRMSEGLRNMERTICLMDDILVHGKSKEEHDQHLLEVLRRLSEAGITLNRKKCVWSQDQVKF